MENASTIKLDRVLDIYSKLTQGEVLGKRELAQQFQVTERSIQRDMSALRCFLAEHHTGQEVIYDKSIQGYYIQDLSQPTLSNDEILAVCKILLESRSMRKDEMLPILDKLISRCVPEQNKRAVQALIANEKHHYIEPHHGKPILSGLWEIGLAIQNHQVLEIEFENAHDLFPTIHRIDRIQTFKVLDEHFHIPYANRFEEGEFRKRIQFMYGGKLERIKFRYTGPSLEAVLDRLPTAEIVASDDSGWTVSAEVFGKGIEMWLRSQGNYVCIE